MSDNLQNTSNGPTDEEYFLFLDEFEQLKPKALAIFLNRYGHQWLGLSPNPLDDQYVMGMTAIGRDLLERLKTDTSLYQWSMEQIESLRWI